MSDSLIEAPAFAPKWVLNGFPKSGLHLLELFVQPLAKPQAEEDTPFRKAWGGTFYDHSWTDRWAPVEQVAYKFGRLWDSHYLRSHTGYTSDLDRFLYLLGVSHVFVYRDLRDVALSQAYHILNEDDEKFVHPDKAAYRALGDFENVLEAVIEGMGDYPGVVARWELYAPWLEREWVCCVRFEDLIADREGQAARILEYGLKRVASIWGRRVKLDRSAFAAACMLMAENSRHTERSPTYRKGQAGGWRDAFTSELCDVFKYTDMGGWIGRLGYEW